MNIDIVNKEVANKLNIKEKEVAKINKFFWDQISKHIHSYTAQPINIPFICVIYPDKYRLKHLILNQLKAIRTIRESTKYKDEEVRQKYIDISTILLRKYLSIRKQSKFTN